MTRPRFVPVDLRSALLGAFTVCLLPACRTEVINPAHTIVSFTQADPSQGGLVVIVAPTAETAAEEQADPQNDASYDLVVDGRELMWDDIQNSVETVQPVVFGAGGAIEAGFYDAGTHHFELAATDSPAVFAFDGVIASGAQTRLYVFGPRGGVQTRFVSYPFEPPAGKEHLSAINLVRTAGVEIEVVSCTDAATCTSVSPPLALGDTFDADLPSGPTSVGESLSLSESGAGYGYRQVAPALPTSPIQALEAGLSVINPGLLPAAYVAAPIYLSSDGTLLEESD